MIMMLLTIVFFTTAEPNRPQTRSFLKMDGAAADCAVAGKAMVQSILETGDVKMAAYGCSALEFKSIS
jgi:hypothetical protein